MSVLLSNGAVVLSSGGLAVASQTSATVTLTRTGSYNVIGEPIVFEATSVTGLDTSEASFVMSDAALDQLVEWEWTITPPAGAATTWAYPTRLMPGHNARMTAYGRWGFIVPDVAGTWTFSVFGVDRNGTPVTASETATVVSRESVVADSAAWLLYDGDLTGAPTHDASNRYTSWDALKNALHAAGSDPVRVRVKGGASSVATGQLSGPSLSMPLVMFHGYGSGKYTVSNNGSFRLIESNFGTARQLIFEDMIFEGPFDANTETGAEVEGVYLGNGHTGSAPWSFRNCELNGWLTGIFTDSSQLTTYVEDCGFTDWAGSAVFMQRPGIHMRGCNMEQPATQPSGGHAKAASFGGIRGEVGILDGCVSFNNSSPFYGAGNAWPSPQPAVRFSVTTSAGGSGRTNAQRCVLSPSVSVQNSGEYGASFGPTNLLLERCTILGHFFPGIIDVDNSGVTVRNCMVLGAAADRAPNLSTTTFINIDSHLDDTGAGVNTDPIRIINNTVVDQNSDAGVSIAEVNVEEAFSTQTISNNTSYAPNYTPAVQPNGALTPQSGITPLAGGARMNYTHYLYNLASGVADGNSSPEIPWWTDVDGRSITQALADGGAEVHYLKNASSGAVLGSTDGLTFSTSATGVTINNNTGSTLAAGNYRIQIDLRHSPPGIIPGTASVANDGRLWSVSATPDNAALVPHFDFFGNTRSSGSPTLGAIDPNGT